MKYQFALAVVLIALCSSGWAQSTYGTITGVISDPSSSVVTNAAVEALNQRTGASRKVTTGSNGFYRFVNVDPGTYTVSAVQQGFAKSERKDIEVPAREEVRIDMQLQVESAAATTIEVTSAAVVTHLLPASHSH